MQPTTPQQQTPRILNHDELKSKWDAFSKIFQQVIEPSTNITAQSLISSLVLNQKKHILDIGCGGGGGSYLIASQMPSDCELTSMDLSSEMIKLTRDRCHLLTQAPFYRKINFVEGSAEKLPFEDETFDAIFSNYCLHLVPNPDQMLKEIHRVLKKGGKACLSVWGRPENSPSFTVMQKAMIECKKRFNVQDESNAVVRSPFHLHQKDPLRERVLNSGFSKCLAWYQFQPFHSFSAREYAELNILTPDFRALVEGSEEKRLEVLSVLEGMANETFEKNEPIGNEVLIVLMSKDE
ncbi:hypothetical protein C9374_010593 [Naegleria lovaniensis]|uniref:Methyltransferase type 11 domain-containing protein n=1 Tax=Naegleria lovaniensis TaxID=51637 RepID=A0AA88GFY0_NAELO|nr:uncharacterized protein C9374_010593 [Naegleria lovaniensis]KAG2374574.1 hypothetical protein C9374_010593 [Naegleria lovaniensis]